MKIGTDRLEAFSDGIIAIIITIMILELKLPDLSKDSSAGDIWTHLNHLLPYFVTYAFSFMMIAIFWTNHHHMFHLLDKADEHLLWQNFIFLFLLSLIPFATSIVGSNPFIVIAPVIYGFVMLLTTFSFATMQHYAIRKELIHKDEDKELTRNVSKVSLKARTKAIVGTLIYLIAIPLAYVNVYIAYACFIIPPIMFFIPQGIDNEKLAEKVAEKNA
jgi:uncharacterized membrane protein